MSTDISSILKTNLDFVRDNAHINLDFVYLQIDHLTTLIGNEEFMINLKDIINQILDRDENGVFDEKDIRLLRDIFQHKKNQLLNIYSFIMEVFNAVLSLVGKIDKTTLKMDKNAIEGLFFGLLSYIMFQYAATNDKDREYIMEIMVTIHGVILTVDNTLGLSKKILDLFKRKGWCGCFYTDSTEKIDREIIRSRERVRDLAVTIKQTEMLRIKVDQLDRKLNALE